MRERKKEKKTKPFIDHSSSYFGVNEHLLDSVKCPKWSTIGVVRMARCFVATMRLCCCYHQISQFETVLDGHFFYFNVSAVKCSLYAVPFGIYPEVYKRIIDIVHILFIMPNAFHAHRDKHFFYHTDMDSCNFCLSVCECCRCCCCCLFFCTTLHRCCLLPVIAIHD